VPNGGCQGGWFDINKTYSDGCECPDTGYSTNCTTATSLTALGYNDSRTVTSQLPASGTEAIWLLVTFPGNNPDPAANTYNPQIRFTQGGGEYVFDVYTNCSNALAHGCGGPPPAGQSEAGSPVNLLSYSMIITAGNFYAPSNGGDCSSNHSNGLNCSNPYAPEPAISGNEQVYIKVHRANTSAVSCNPFTLVASD
jgi:hypothetical protein